MWPHWALGRWFLLLVIKDTVPPKTTGLNKLEIHLLLLRTTLFSCPGTLEPGYLEDTFDKF